MLLIISLNSQHLFMICYKTDTDIPCLHLVYEMWDSKIKKVKARIYRHESLEANEYSSFFNVVYDILIDWWIKNCTPLHYLAHSLNPKYFHFLFSLVPPFSKTHVLSFIFVFYFYFLTRYYSIEWLSENSKRDPPKRVPPHQDYEISIERSKSLEQYFENEYELRMVKVEFATFSGGRFPSPDVLIDKWVL